jgi:hypothetical protein
MYGREKEVEMGRACCTYGEEECILGFGGKPEEKRPSDLYACGKIIFE